jgi:tetratricopeptide (TPR) repeat protein
MKNILGKPCWMVIAFCWVWVGFCTEVSAQKQKKNKQEHNVGELIESATKSDEQTMIEAEYQLVEGMKFFILEEFNQALERFQKALALSKGNASIRYKIAETYYKMGDLSKAQIYAEEALAEEKKNLFFYVMLAKIYEEQGKNEQAIKVYQDFFNSKVSKPEYYYDLANVYLKQNETEKALATFDKLEQEIGVNETSSLKKQKIYLKLNQPEKALAEIEKLIQLDPENESYISSWVELLINTGKTDKALAFLEQHPSLDAKTALILAQIYRSQGEFNKAITQLKNAFGNPDLEASDKVNLMVEWMQDDKMNALQNEFTMLGDLIVQTHPFYAKAYTLYGDMLLLQNDKSKALKQYTQSIYLDDTNPQIWQQILNMEAEMSQFDSLSKHADLALEVFPNQAVFWMFSGLGHYSLKKYDQASLSFEEGKRLAFNNMELLADFNVYLGDTYNALKQYEESDMAYEAVLKNTPDNPQALNNYSYYLALRKDKISKAKELAERLIQKYPDNANYMDTYGWVLYQAKEYQKAKKILERASQTSQDGTILEHYGDVLFQLGEKENALNQWLKAKQLGGTSALIDKKITEKQLYE